jgi:sensor histidine kinase YesM
VDEGELCISVRNCIPEASERLKVRGRKGVGLQNVRRRLEAVYGKRATLDAEPEDGSFVARIRIPEIQQAS